MSLKQRLFGVFRNPQVESWVDWLDGRLSDSLNLLRVLTYHRIDNQENDPALYPGGISATPQTFAKQMEFLVARYRFVHIDDVLQAFHGQKALPARAILLTFDDAYVDFQRNAWPLLKRLEIPAVLFVPTAYPDNPSFSFWWDRLYRKIQETPKGHKLKTPIGSWTIDGNQRQVFRELRDHVKSTSHDQLLKFVDKVVEGNRSASQSTSNSVLSWNDLRQLKNEGLVLGAHTETHPLVNRINLKRARQEVCNSQQTLREQTGDVRPIFAYPSGGFSNQTTEMLREEGFQLAFTTRRGINNVTAIDPLCLRRINVGLNTSCSLLQAQLLSPARRLNRFWRE